MIEKTMVENVKAFAASKALSYLDGDPDKNIPKLLEWVDKFDKKDEWLTQRNAFRAVIENPDNNWYKLIKSLWTDIDDGVRKVFFENFIINSNLIGAPREEKMRKEHGCNIPWAILMDPTSACNLKCKGCWAAEYGNRLNMSYEQLDDIQIHSHWTISVRKNNKCKIPVSRKYQNTTTHFLDLNDQLVNKET